MKILVTGGAGFIGSHIVDNYLADGHEVVVIDALFNKHPNMPAKDVKFIHANLVDCDLSKIINQEKFDVINHHAAQVNVRTSLSDPTMDAQHNIIATIRLLQAAVMAKKPVEKFIFASSGGAIYGVQDEYPSPETAPLKPESPYGLAKLTAEQYIEFFHKTYGLGSVILRYSNVYGPRQHPKGEAGVVAIFCDHFFRNEAPTIFGDGGQTRDFVYVGDVARANLLALDKQAQGIYNIGTGIETSVNKVVDLLKSLIKSDLQAKHSASIPGELQRSSVAIDHIKNKLGWQPRIDLGAGLAETISSLR